MTSFQSWVKFSFMDKKKALDRIGKSPEELKYLPAHFQKDKK